MLGNNRATYLPGTLLLRKITVTQELTYGLINKGQSPITVAAEATSTVKWVLRCKNSSFRP